jgi:hypothetical protein
MAGAGLREDHRHVIIVDCDGPMLLRAPVTQSHSQLVWNVQIAITTTSAVAVLPCGVTGGTCSRELLF